MSCELPPLLGVPFGRSSGDAAPSLPTDLRPFHERRARSSAQAQQLASSDPASARASPRRPPRPPSGPRGAANSGRTTLGIGDFHSAYLGSSATGARPARRNGEGSARSASSPPRSASAPPGSRPASGVLLSKARIGRTAASDCETVSGNDGAASGVEGSAAQAVATEASQEEARKAAVVFRRRTLQRVAKQARAERKAQKFQRRQAAIRAFSHVDTAAFHRETQVRVTQAHLKSMELEPGTRPARIAIVGAGPVGLWTAVLLARQHTILTANSSGPPRIACPPSAPKVDVLEHRSDDSGYGTRRIVLAMATATQDMLNKNLTSGRSLASEHAFSPTCSINFVEAKLRENFERYVAAGFGSLRFGVQVSRPEALFAEGYDVVIVAAGRQAMDDEWREANGFAVSTSNPEDALILKYHGSVAAGAHLNDKVSRAVGGGVRIFLRPGAVENQGWAWIMGLPAALAARVRTELARLHADDQGSFPTFSALWAALGDDELLADSCSGGTSDFSGQAMRLLDEALQPTEVTARVTTAAFWHSESVARRVQSADTDGWLVLAGDVGSGRPFYLGSTLNGHLHDVTTLAQGPPWSRWDPEGSPFKKYAERYRARTSAVGYRRPPRPTVTSSAGPAEDSARPDSDGTDVADEPASDVVDALC